MSPEEKIIKIMDSCLRALENINQGNKKLAIGDLHHAMHKLTAAESLLWAEIEEEENNTS
ncbi:hypothetical protein [uncultured Metabacillus sp.]|uniref:hypothetical protein n=1 Tax=uncultured Metabacillus sp. TaxID=2860135 RepID=UPI0026097460|nr:hypothetical protein [uncultured Metabacillus sp.]